MPLVTGNPASGLKLTKKGRAGRVVAMFARAGAVGFLALTLLHGLQTGGHLKDPRNPLYGLTGNIAGYFGYAAKDISIAGLERQAAKSVLSLIGIEPNDPMFLFDAVRAKRILENIDWIEHASVRRIYPNRLEIEVVEREPFAVWQRDGVHYVIDRTGAALSTLAAENHGELLLVTGEGANKSVFDLVNHLEKTRGIYSRVKAAARVGMRRWTLYLKGGGKVALPEHGIADALVRLGGLHERTKILDKQFMLADMRLADRITIKNNNDEQGAERLLKVSNR